MEFMVLLESEDREKGRGANLNEWNVRIRHCNAG